MLAINWVQSNIKSINTKAANIPIRFISLLIETTSVSTSGYYFKLENIFFLLTNNK